MIPHAGVEHGCLIIRLQSLQHCRNLKQCVHLSLSTLNLHADTGGAATASWSVAAVAVSVIVVMGTLVW